MTVPVALLNQVPAARCEWLVPGLLKEKVRTLAKSVPQRLRHKLGPLEEFAEGFAAAAATADAPLAQALARHIRAQLNLEVPLDAFRPDSAPPHLHMNFLVVDEHGRQLAMGRNLEQLKRELGEHTTAALQSEAPRDEGERYTGWTMGDLAEVMEIVRGGQTLVGYPALVDAGDAVTLQVFDAPEKARELHRAGVRRLLGIAFRDRVRELERSWARDMVVGPVTEDLVAAALDRVFLGEALPMTQADFARRVEEGRSRFILIAQEMARTASAILAAHAELEQFGWLLEELRVSLFAQELKTPVPVSPKRLAKLWQSIRR